MCPEEVDVFLELHIRIPQWYEDMESLKYAGQPLPVIGGVGDTSVSSDANTVCEACGPEESSAKEIGGDGPS